MGNRVLKAITHFELEVLRAAPYESPMAISKAGPPLRAAVKRLVALGLMEVDADALLARQTDEGAAQAEPLTLREARAAVTGPFILAIAVYRRFAAEVALTDLAGVDPSAEVAERERMRKIAVILAPR